MNATEPNENLRTHKVKDLAEKFKIMTEMTIKKNFTSAPPQCACLPCNLFSLGPLNIHPSFVEKYTHVQKSFSEV